MLSLLTARFSYVTFPLLLCNLLCVHVLLFHSISAHNYHLISQILQIVNLIFDFFPVDFFVYHRDERIIVKINPTHSQEKELVGQLRQIYSNLDLCRQDINRIVESFHDRIVSVFTLPCFFSCSPSVLPYYLFFLYEEWKYLIFKDIIYQRKARDFKLDNYFPDSISNSSIRLFPHFGRHCGIIWYWMWILRTPRSVTIPDYNAQTLPPDWMPGTLAPPSTPL